MHRRELPGLLFATAAGSALMAPRAQAHSTAPPYYARTQPEITAGITPTDHSHEPGNVQRYGADPTGVADSTNAIRNACLTTHPVRATRGGVFRITGSLRLRDYLDIDFNGAVLLIDGNVPAVENITGTSVLYVSIRNIILRANTVIGASALPLTDVSRSTFSNIVIDRSDAPNAFAYAVRLQGSASACYWNRFYSIEATAVTAGFVRIGGGSNDNYFFDSRLINHISAHNTPVGIWIESGSNNRFYGVTLEAIFRATAAEAYAVRLDTNAVHSGIYGLRTEAHTGSTSAFGIYWNGGQDNQIVGHYSLGALTRSKGLPSGNVYISEDFVAGDRLELTDGVSAPGAITGRASIYIDSADGDLKVRFADGTVRIIVTD